MILTRTAAAAVLGAVLAAGMALAQGAQPTDPDAVLRSQTMKAVGGAMKVLGDMAGGKAEFDAAAAEAAKTDLINAATAIPKSFANQGAADPASEAKPEIWSNWDEFLQDAEALKAAAEAADVSSVDAIKASMGALGGSCKDCHSEFRM